MSVKLINYEQDFNGRVKNVSHDDILREYDDLHPDQGTFEATHYYVRSRTNPKTKQAKGWPEKFVCFSCRISKKCHSSSREQVHSYRTLFAFDHLGQKPPTCHRCNKELKNVGPKFEAPPQDDLKGWESSEKMFRLDRRCFDFKFGELERKCKIGNVKLEIK